MSDDKLECIRAAFLIRKFALGMTVLPTSCDVCQKSEFLKEVLEDILNPRKGWLLNLCEACQRVFIFGESSKDDIRYAREHF